MYQNSQSFFVSACVDLDLAVFVIAAQTSLDADWSNLSGSSTTRHLVMASLLCMDRYEARDNETNHGLYLDAQTNKRSNTHTHTHTQGEIERKIHAHTQVHISHRHKQTHVHKQTHTHTQTLTHTHTRTHTHTHTRTNHPPQFVGYPSICAVINISPATVQPVCPAISGRILAVYG